jgi:hypothetical protein
MPSDSPKELAPYDGGHSNELLAVFYRSLQPRLEASAAQGQPTQSKVGQAVMQFIAEVYLEEWSHGPEAKLRELIAKWRDKLTNALDFKDEAAQPHTELQV